MNRDSVRDRAVGKLGDERRAAQFVSYWFGFQPDGVTRRPRHLYAGHIDAASGKTGRFEHACFDGTAAGDLAMEAWIRDRDGAANIWFPVNFLLPAFRGRGSKKDYGAISALHLDWDPPGPAADATGFNNVDRTSVRHWRRAAIDLLRKYKIPPKAIVCTGRGIGAFWPLKVPLALPDGPERNALIEKVESRNLGLLRAFGVSDESTRDITRIMKVPFTTAIPNERKRSLFPGSVCARVIEGESDV